MKVRSDNNIYQVIDEVLKKASAPMTCAELMEVPEIREAAVEKFGSNIQVATNKLSDILGFLWRRASIARFDAPPSRSMARYAYGYLNKPEARNDEPPKPLSPPIPLHVKPSFRITEKNGDVVIDFPSFTITVTPK